MRWRTMRAISLATSWSMGIRAPRGNSRRRMTGRVLTMGRAPTSSMRSRLLLFLLSLLPPPVVWRMTKT